VCTLSACGSNESGGQSSAAGAAGTGPAVGCSNASVDGFEPGLKKPGSSGQVDFTWLSSNPAPPAIDDNTFVIQVTDADGEPVEGELSVALDMPEHGHPSPALPDITYDPETRAFTLEPMRLFMVGLWRITYTFVPASEPDSDGDSAVFELCID
jgi:hypothetical protein